MEWKKEAGNEKEKWKRERTEGTVRPSKNSGYNLEACIRLRQQTSAWQDYTYIRLFTT